MAASMQLCTLADLKTALDLNDLVEDQKLTLFINWASELIETYLDRQFLQQSYTQYLNGSGTPKLLLKYRPVLLTPTPLVYLDENDAGGMFGQPQGSFDSTTLLTLGTDYALWVDQPDGSSRSGILIRIRNVWPMGSYRQRGYLSAFVAPQYGNVKVVYTGGYASTATLPYQVTAACVALASKIRFSFPWAIEVAGSSYEELSVSQMSKARQNYLFALARPMLVQMRNWKC